METLELVAAMGGWMLLGGVPIWLARRARRPAAEGGLLRIRVRPAARVLLGSVPVALAALTLLVLWMTVSLGWSRAGLAGAAVGALVASLLTFPFLTLGWAWRRVVTLGCVADGTGLYLMGSHLPWEDVEVEQSREGLVIRRRSRRLFGRSVLRAVAWEIEPGTAAHLRELGRAHASLR